MAATYGLYSSLKGKTGDLISKAEDLKGELSSNKSKLSSHKSGLTDDIWKAKSKNTLTTAYDKIESEVLKEIEEQLDKIKTVCGYVNDYHTAETNALDLKKQIEAAVNNKKDPSLIKQALIEEEKKMDSAEENVKGMC